MRVMITGAAGLYGVHLIDELVKRADISKVIGVDNFSRNYLFAEKFLENIEKDRFKVLKGYNEFRSFTFEKSEFDDNFAVVDPFIKSPEFFEKFEIKIANFQDFTAEEIDEMQVDAIIHLAASISIPESMVQYNKYFKNNELGTFRLLNTLVKTKSKPLIMYASSPEVYGNPEYIPMDEKHPKNPHSTYAVTKLAAEKHCMVMHKWHSYPLVIIRNFNTFGENQNIWEDAAVISNFVSNALQGEDLVIYGDGSATRDFQYVKDAVKAYSLVLGRNDLIGETFNIGTGVQTSIRELAEMVIRLTGSNSKIVYKESRAADVLRLHADYSSIRSKTGWSPKFSLEEGLKRTIEWYRLALGLR